MGGDERPEVSPVDTTCGTTTSRSTGDTGYPRERRGYRADDATTSGILPYGAVLLSQIGKVGASRGGLFVTDGTTGRALCDAATMVLEIADFTIVSGQEEAFAAAFREGVAQLRASPGFRSARMTRGIESPSRFVLLVEWDDLEAHTVTFRESERFTRWREIVGPFFDGTPRVEHVVEVATEG